MKDIVDEIDTRIKNPLFGYFIFSFFAINWEEVFYLSMDASSVSDRIKYFHMGTDYLSLFVYPFLIACAYSILYPWLQCLFIFFSTKPTELNNFFQVKMEHKLLIKKKELEDIRSQFLKNAEMELIDRAKRDVELDNIKNDDIRNKLQEEIEALRKERDHFRVQLNDKSKSDFSLLSEEQENILRIITSNGGEMSEEGIIEASKHDKVKTEYFLEDLIQKNYLTKNWKNKQQRYVYSLTINSKKIMVDKGIVQ